MNVIVFGATGRVGKAAVKAAVGAGHHVRAAVRSVANPSPFDESVTRVLADVRAPETVRASIADVDAIIVAVGANVFKPSDVVSVSAETVISEARAMGIRRYIGITGIAQMRPIGIGHVVQAVLRVSPIRYAVADHQRAYEIVVGSDLDWTLAGCPWIKDAAHVGNVKQYPDVFPGGFHTVSPDDVGSFLASQVESKAYLRRVVGLW